MMNKIGFVAALMALVVASCAAEYPPVSGEGSVGTKAEHAGWNCGAVDGEAIRKPVGGTPALWTSQNDAYCRRTCGRTNLYPVYKDGNWALFSDTGLECCCAGYFFFPSRHRYAITKPYISAEMAKILGISGRDHPLD